MLVVLLHPLPLDEAAWDDVRDRLPGAALALRLYDLGDSVEEWAAAVLRTVGSEPLIAVGNSVGGSCAIEMARLAPDQVRELVLIGAKAGHRPEPEFCEAAVTVLREQGVDAAWRRYWQVLLGPHVPDEVRERAEGIARSQPVEALVKGVKAFHSRADRSAFLHRWPHPVSMVAGKFDFAAHRTRQTADELVHGRFVSLPGVGHYGPLEAPEAVASVIRQSIERHGSGFPLAP